MSSERVRRPRARDLGIDVTVEPVAGDATSQLSRTSDAARTTAGSPWDGWLTIVARRRDRPRRARPASLTPRRLAVGAHRPVAARARRSGRTGAEVLAAHCAARVDWKCIGDVAGRPWSSIGGDGRVGRREAGPRRPGDRRDRPPRDRPGRHASTSAAPTSPATTTPTTGSSSGSAASSADPRLDPAIALRADARRRPGDSTTWSGTTEAEAGPLLARRRTRPPDPGAPALPCPGGHVPMSCSCRSPARRGRTTCATSSPATTGGQRLARAGWRVDGESACRGVPQLPGPAGATEPPDGRFARGAARDLARGDRMTTRAERYDARRPIATALSAGTPAWTSAIVAGRRRRARGRLRDGEHRVVAREARAAHRPREALRALGRSERSTARASTSTSRSSRRVRPRPCSPPTGRSPP